MTCSSARLVVRIFCILNKRLICIHLSRIRDRKINHCVFTLTRDADVARFAIVNTPISPTRSRGWWICARQAEYGRMTFCSFFSFFFDKRAASPDFTTAAGEHARHGRIIRASIFEQPLHLQRNGPAHCVIPFGASGTDQPKCISPWYRERRTSKDPDRVLSRYDPHFRSPLDSQRTPAPLTFDLLIRWSGSNTL